MYAIFLLQDNVIFHHQQSLKELLDFHTFHHNLTYMHVLFFQYYEAHIRYYELFIIFFFQTFSSLFYMKDKFLFFPIILCNKRLNF